MTIYEIARQAGVSAMTVSRVLNGTGRVSPATRERILGLIRKLRFTPNAAARSLVFACADRLAFLHEASRVTELSGLLIGVLEESNRIGAQVVLQEIEPGTIDAGLCVRQLADSGVAGAILPAPLCDYPRLVEALHAADISVVTIASGRPLAGTFCVRIDEYVAAREMTQHLLALGHRRIGFIRGNPNESASEERWRGFVAALRDAGIDASEVHVEQGFCTYRSGLEAARTLLSLWRVPTAIFASNDEMAAAVIAEAHRRRIDVPGSLSVVGFGDRPAACNIWPELTTVRQPVSEMATEAVNLLVQEIRSARSGTRSQGQCRVLAHTLVERGSTSSAPVEQ